MTAGFSGPLLRAGPAAQAPLLRQLAHALDRVAHLDLAGVRLMLGSEYGVDSLGQLWLDAGDSALSWAGCATHFSPSVATPGVMRVDGRLLLACHAPWRLSLYSFFQQCNPVMWCSCSWGRGAVVPAMGSP